MFACWSSFYPFLNEKVFLFHCKCHIETRFSRCSSQEFAAFTVQFVWLQLSEHVDITVSLITCNAKREISEFFSLCDSYQAKITQVIRSFLAFLNVRNYLHSCIYLFLFRYF